MSLIFVVLFRVSTAMSCIRLQKHNDIGERVPTRNINVLFEYSRFNAVKEKKRGGLGQPLVLRGGGSDNSKESP